MKNTFLFLSISASLSISAIQRFPQELLDEHHRKQNTEFPQRLFVEIENRGSKDEIKKQAISFIKAVVSENKSGKSNAPIGSKQLAKRLDQKAQKALHDVTYHTKAIKEIMKMLFPVKDADKKSSLQVRLGFLPQEIGTELNHIIAGGENENKEEQEKRFKALEKQDAHDHNQAVETKVKELHKHQSEVQQAIYKALIAQYATYLHNKLIIHNNNTDINMRYDYYRKLMLKEE